MKTTKIAIFSALTLTAQQMLDINDGIDDGVPLLLDLVGTDVNGIKQIFSFYPPTNATYPCVGFYRLSGQAGSAGGKISKNKNELYSIDCFGTNATVLENIEMAIDKAMDTLEYTVTTEHMSDIYEDGTKIFHKLLRYRIK